MDSIDLKNSNIFKTVIPSKMLEFMACGRPIILGVDGEAREIIQRANAGIFIPPEDSEKLVEAIIKLKKDASLREKMGRNGRKCVLSEFTRERKAKDYLKLLESLV